MDEFELIRRFVDPVARATRNEAVRLGPGDDGAIQSVPAGYELVFSIDTMVAGVHFPNAYPGHCLATRALGAAVSDLAAMGADPVCFTLSLTLPHSDEAFLSSFFQSLSDRAQALGVALAGGDVTAGPLSVSVQAHGQVPAGAAITRGGAKPDQLVVVSGTLGDAAGALDMLDRDRPNEYQGALLARYHRPEPRLALGQRLRSMATAAVDVSDGLLADLGHLLVASGCGATIDASAVPCSDALLRCAGQGAGVLALTGGDDYELCFTLPEVQWSDELSETVPLTVIGRTHPAPGLDVVNRPPGLNRAMTGYDHFGGGRE
ncbi:thiamine-phosphate kinase [Tamilnaduibacter salinus]|uniref:Thiamine-monophosphate kinase n=1 Tax=Tamilnaduibacter salinus TaxID=1484056 RepID=A0A2A2HZV4_9GAMM|nr:thiamine-phosphate kinase [Tamilnaduibacter salinus]PAV24586.1 thiamine-phosphate kinase [Tamilnaduibacter salinus]